MPSSRNLVLSRKLVLLIFFVMVYIGKSKLDAFYMYSHDLTRRVHYAPLGCKYGVLPLGLVMVNKAGGGEIVNKKSGIGS